MMIKYQPYIECKRKRAEPEINCTYGLPIYNSKKRKKAKQTRVAIMLRCNSTLPCLLFFIACVVVLLFLCIFFKKYPTTLYRVYQI
jgi:hypothetical protein